MRQTEKLMEQIAEIMTKTPYFHEFQAVVLGGDAKKTFLWLDEKWRNGGLPAELRPLLTDIFFMMH